MTDPEADDSDPREGRQPTATRVGVTLVEALAAAGVETAVLAPGSRCTPLTLAFDAHPDVTAVSLLDERSAAFFALGRGRRSGDPTAVVTTSGTATANLHPAAMEADGGRVPLVLLTADRPPELRDSGANQTVDQTDLYGDCVRFQRDLPIPPDETASDGRPGRDRVLRSLRVTAARAVAASRGPPAGPVHLNCPFRKPLQPESGRAPEMATAAEQDPPVRSTVGRPTLDDPDRERLRQAITSAGRGLIVAGPVDPGDDPGPILDLARETGFPLLADPLSGLRFGAARGPHHASGGDETTAMPTDGSPLVCTGYDAILDPGVVSEWSDPDVVLRFGASPTSKTLRTYLADTDSRQFLVDAGGGWREATFTATDLVAADPGRLATQLAADLEAAAEEPVDPDWRQRFARAERTYWDLVADHGRPVEARIVAATLDAAPQSATVTIGNSTPIRDCDRFVATAGESLTVIGNRGASGIDGTISTALGAGHAADEPAICVLGDLAAYHDANALLTVDRCGIDATIVVINNDGGGIFHMLPIAEFEPFERRFRTPHGLTFAAVADQFDLAYESVGPDSFRSTYRDAVRQSGGTIVEVETDSTRHHEERDALQETVRSTLGS